MDHRFMHKLERLAIVDALVSPTGYRVDHVQHPDGDLKPCYAVLYNGETLMLTRQNQAIDRWTVRHFLHHVSNNDWLGLPTPGDEWEVKRSGSEGNPLWAQSSYTFSVPNHTAFIGRSPYTGVPRTTATIVQRRNELPVWDGDQIKAVEVCKNWGGVVEARRHFEVGNLYIPKQKARQRLKKYCEYLRLTKIESVQVCDLTLADLHREGLCDWSQFRQQWEQASYGRFDPRKWVWILTFTRVFTLTPFRPLDVGEEPPDVLAFPVPIQMPLLDFVAAGD